MTRRMKAGRWIAAFLAIVLLLLSLLAGIARAVDPFFQFRVQDNRYMLYGFFAGPGLVKNYDYDTLILGSSLTQNFHMDLFRQELGGKPLHIGLGGISDREILEFMDAAYKAGRAERYYVGVDLSMFATEGTSHTPAHLLRDDFLSHCRYLLSYEVWFRFLPVDLCLRLVDRLGLTLPPKFAERCSIDWMGNWEEDVQFGEEIVLENYRSGAYSVSEIDTRDLYPRMTARIDSFLDGFRFEQGEHSFFFPPYSALYWCNAQELGYFEDFLRAKQYFIEKAQERGAKVYDFQAEKLTTDLDNYKDTTHYGPAINDWMTRCFANGDCLVTEENRAALEQALIENTQRFRERYAALFQP